jgi:hypothetical protein
MDEKIYTLTDEGTGEGQPAQQSIEKRAELLRNDALVLVLRHLGVDLSGNINQQIESMEIIIEHCDEESSAETRGIYVLKRQAKDILPVAFIGNTRVQDQKIETDLVMFRGVELSL